MLQFRPGGVADRPVGQFAIAGASLGELIPVVLLSLFFSGRTTDIGSKLLLLSLLGILVVLVVIGTLRIERSMWITRMINRLADTSAQIRIRLSMLLVVGLGALATHLGFEAILGAFIAGAILRLVDADAEHKHPLFHPKLDAIGYGFLIPVFFVTSGLTFNVSVLFSSASTVLRVPLFLLALLVVRGLPAVLYRSALPSIRDVPPRDCSRQRRCPSSSPPPPSGFRCTPSGRPTRPHSSPQGFSASSFSQHLAAVAAVICLKARAWSWSRRPVANSLKCRDQRRTARGRGVRGTTKPRSGHRWRPGSSRPAISCQRPGSPPAPGRRYLTE
jgi:hypothetical protein